MRNLLLVALVGASSSGFVAAQSYNAGNDAARRAAEQASQDRARAAASQLEADRQRAQREQMESQRRQSTYSSPSPPPYQSQPSSPSMNAPGGAPSTYSRPMPTGPDYSRWTKGSAYRASVSMNPPPGQGSIGDWQYEVRHDAGGRYAFGKISTTARDPKNSATVLLSITCDLRNRVADERGGKIFGPLAVEVDHRLVTQGRVPSGVGLSDKGSGYGRYSNLEWERGGELSRLRDVRYAQLNLQLQFAVSHGALRVNVVEGGGVGRSGVFEGGQLKAAAEVSDTGLEKAFEKLAPCWDTDWWNWPVAGQSAAQSPAGPEAGRTAPPAAGSTQQVAVQPASVRKATWELIQNSAQDDLYIDGSSVVRSGDVATARVLTDYKQPKYAGSTAFLSMVQVTEYKCSELKFRIRAGEGYSEKMATGRLIGSERYERPWTDLGLTSNGANILRKVC